MKISVLLTILTLSSYGMLFCQDVEESYYSIDSISVNKKVRIVGLPIAFYTPENSFGFGGGAQVFLLNQSNIYNSRQSNILVSGIYTLNQQILIDVKPQIYLLKGNYLLDVSYKFQIFPNSFWGIGGDTPDENEESYDMTSSELNIGFIKRLPPNLNFGFELIFHDHNITEIEEGGLLDEGDIPGSTGATLSGLGVLFNLDTRDNIASPFRGNLLQMKAQFSSQNFGASSDFNRFIFDLRTYRGLGKKSIVAMQLYSENVFGEVPFQGKAWYGGGSRARGYFRGRYIDDLLYVAQAEYRLRFHDRWTAAGFLLVGEVADEAGNLFKNIKPSAGGGIRYKFVKDQDTLLRLDIGIGVDGNSGFYFGVNEAF